MGSCASRSSSSAPPAELTTAKVVDMDGSMAQFAAPVTAHEALAAITGSGTSSSFLCCSDELFFDAPVRALAAHDALRAGQIYFALPLAMLRRLLSGQDMAALAAKASAALGGAPVVVAVDDADDDDDRIAGVASSTSSKGKKNGDGEAAAAAGKQRRRRQQKRRIAPLVVLSGDERAHADSELKGWHVYGGNDPRKTAVYGGDQTVGKTRNGACYRGGARRRFSAVQRLSVIVEAASE